MEKSPREKSPQISPVEKSPLPVLQLSVYFNLFLEVDYPFLDISALDDVYINFGVLYVFVIYLLVTTYTKQGFSPQSGKKV